MGVLTGWKVILLLTTGVGINRRQNKDLFERANYLHLTGANLKPCLENIRKEVGKAMAGRCHNNYIKYIYLR